MKRFLPNLTLLALALTLAGVPTVRAAEAPAPAARGLKICVSADAPAEVRQAAESVLAQVKTHSLLRVLAGEHAPAAVTESAGLLNGKPESPAYDNLVLIGLDTDPMIHAAWSHEARVTGPNSLYLFGFGHLQGDIGWVESDRNPFLHSRFIARAPYETEAITLTGTTPAGVVLAVQSFLGKDLVNGVVAVPGWKRAEPNLLQRDPLAPSFQVPEICPPIAGEWVRLGFTQGAEDEYRGVLEDTGVEPHEIWRAKYYHPGVWDGAGAAHAISEYNAGLHRRASGNSLWGAKFASEAEAKAAALKIAQAARLRPDGAVWRGTQPPLSNEKESPGPLTLLQRAEWVLMSTVPEPRVLESGRP